MATCQRKNLSLFFSILDFGQGSKALRLARHWGAVYEIVFLGKGIIRDGLLNILGLSELRREIFLAIVDEGSEDVFYREMSEKFGLDKLHRGIAFSLPLKGCLKVGGKEEYSFCRERGEDTLGYDAIFIIVNKGLSDRVLEAAKGAGSTGGTVIHGRGSGSSEKEKLFNIVIEPEKDIILILAKTEVTAGIVKAVKEGLNLDSAGTGIIFVTDVSKTVGLYNG